MATDKQRQAARQNVRKAQAGWKRMTSSERARSQPEGRARKKPATTGQGNYYHVEVRPKEDFTTFRTQDVGGKGHLQRVAGKRSSGSWATTKWLIGKQDAHVEAGKLVGDTQDARDLLEKLGSQPVHLRGDRFEAKPRRNIPERAKPTAAQKRAAQKRAAQKRAGRQNIGKAQAAGRKKS